MGWWNESQSLARALERIAPVPAKVAARLRREVDAFKQNLPIVTCLASKALRKRHWDDMSADIGGEVRADGDRRRPSLVGSFSSAALNSRALRLGVRHVMGAGPLPTVSKGERRSRQNAHSSFRLAHVLLSRRRASSSCRTRA